MESWEKILEESENIHLDITKARKHLLIIPPKGFFFSNAIWPKSTNWREIQLFAGHDLFGNQSLGIPSLLRVNKDEILFCHELPPITDQLISVLKHGYWLSATNNRIFTHTTFWILFDEPRNVPIQLLRQLTLVYLPLGIDKPTTYTCVCGWETNMKNFFTFHQLDCKEFLKAKK